MLSYLSARDGSHQPRRKISPAPTLSNASLKFSTKGSPRDSRHNKVKAPREFDTVRHRAIWWARLRVAKRAKPLVPTGHTSEKSGRSNCSGTDHTARRPKTQLLRSSRRTHRLEETKNPGERADSPRALWHTGEPLSVGVCVWRERAGGASTFVGESKRERRGGGGAGRRKESEGHGMGGERRR